MRDVWRKIKIRFLKHELWVATNALDLPFFSLFSTMTLFIWVLLPISVVAMPFVQFIPEGGFSIAHLDGPTKILTILVWGIGLTVLLVANFVLFFWWGRWYLICAGLMIGSETMAKVKLTKIQAKLKALTDE